MKQLRIVLCLLHRLKVAVVSSFLARDYAHRLIELKFKNLTVFFNNRSRLNGLNITEQIELQLRRV